MNDDFATLLLLKNFVSLPELGNKTFVEVLSASSL